MGGMASATSRESPASLPERWAEEIFKRMESHYGARWVDALGGFDRERVKQAWGEELAGFLPGEISAGLRACTLRPWPPTLPEFLLLCRPLPDSRADFEQARVQMALRLRGKGDDRWSRAAVYWAAVSIGNYDLQTLSWETLRGRWEYALSTARSEQIPEYLAALPPAGQQSVTREVAQKRMAVLLSGIKTPLAKDPSKDWALALARKEAAGEHVAWASRSSWREALGFQSGISAVDAMRSVPAHD